MPHWRVPDPRPARVAVSDLVKAGRPQVALRLLNALPRHVAADHWLQGWKRELEFRQAKADR